MIKGPVDANWTIVRVEPHKLRLKKNKDFL